MRLQSLLLLSLLAVTPCASAEEVQSSPDNAIVPRERPLRLFDGKSLGNTYTFLKDTGREDPRKVFRVTDGMLHITGDGLGSIITKDRYRDYHLVLEFKWGDKTWHDRENAARDSGLLIHSNGADGGYQGIWMPSIEVQIIEGGVGDFILVNGPDEMKKPVDIAITAETDHDRDDEVIWKAGGKRESFDRAHNKRINWFGRDPDWKDEKGFRGSVDVESPHGKWTRLDVYSDADHITVYVNGTKVNEGFGVRPSAGRIQLQCELAEIF